MGRSAMAEPRIAFAAAGGDDWRGRDLTGAQVRFCDLAGLDLSGAAAGGSFWQHCSLRHADLSGADLAGAVLVDCDLSGADLRGTDLAEARLRRCTLEDARLDGCDLDGAALVGCSLADAQLDGVRNASSARDLVVEMLRRRAGDDPELQRWVGLVALRRDWCYEEFAAALAAHPELRALALDALRALPRAGLAEALETARQPAVPR